MNDETEKTMSLRGFLRFKKALATATHSFFNLRKEFAARIRRQGARRQAGRGTNRFLGIPFIGPAVKLVIKLHERAFFNAGNITPGNV